ncbi:MAG TPA: AMP-binding protein [Pseudonocardiaceae bacterium]|jgi:acyl-CoA synthetase (AMP-forming)/AMP-acid ligase II|nr:AMP-binding protein [Pseudonocardiaceae bacterium]
MAVVSELLARRADERPDLPAFLSGSDGRALTWRFLAENADALRALAAERNIPAHGRIGLVLEDPLFFTTTYLGALAAGLTVVPIDPRLTAAERTASLATLKVDVLAADQPETLAAQAEIETWAISADGPELVRGSTARPSERAAQRPAVLLASSGTTGTPKGIPLSEWQLLDAAARVAEHHGLTPDERGYTPLPLFHVNAQVMGLLATVVSGASLVLDRRFDKNEYWARVARWSPTWLNAVPAILTSLLDVPAPPADLAARIRFARSASAPLPEATSRAFAEHTGVSVLETYGMTEAAGQITANPIDPAARRVGSVGLPVGLELAVLGPDDEPVAPGEEGMVALRGPQIVEHYLTLSDVDDERLRPARDESGWLRTGDLGTRDEAGFVRLAGRADDVINRGGEKIHPQEVENVLLAHPGVRSAAVVAAPHDRLGQVAVAFVTAEPEAVDGLAEELHVLCEQRLTRYKRPTQIEITGALPTGPTGKVLRRALRAGLAASGGSR